MENLKRVHWKSKLGFLLAAIGSAVGLGNIWRFPYVAYKNGGGAFLIPYLIALLLVGIPLLVLEHGLGQLKKGSAPLAFGKIRRGWEYLGWWVSVFICFGLMLYYSAVLSWCVHYFGFSFSGAWGENTQAFFFQDFLQLSESPFDIGSINWSIFAGIAVVWFVNWLVISRGIRKGIEIANKIGMPLLFATLLLLLVWSLLLPGASTGVAALVVPNLSKLLSPSVWHDAFGQIFFTLSLGSGVMIVFASYLPDRKNLTGNAIKTAAANSTVELIAGFAVFAIIGYIATNAGKPIDQAVQSGPGLAFVVYPQAISHLPFGNVPFGNVLFGALFFFTLLLAGLTSSISIIET
ncbi:MAG: sodium-dependent transporter, partial [Deltaproteobacteria bacterium CG_4_10_14_0_2_um_filter_43_8]